MLRTCASRGIWRMDKCMGRLCWQHGGKFSHAPRIAVLSHENNDERTLWEKERLGLEEREAVIGDFIKIINHARLTGFGVGIDVKYWKSFTAHRKRLLGGDAQLFAFQRVLRMMSDRMELVNNRDFVEAYFDNDNEFSGARLHRFNRIRKEHKALVPYPYHLARQSIMSHYRPPTCWRGKLGCRLSGGGTASRKPLDSSDFYRRFQPGLSGHTRENL